VRVSSKPAGIWVDSVALPEPAQQLVVRTPATLHVADSVRTLHVVVVGAGAVRLYFGEQPSAREQRRAAWGRDITLERGEDGHFRPMWKVHPLP
jgi:hypothetical protein